MVAGGQRGFALVEVAVAVVVVAIVASFAFGGESRELRQVAQAFAETRVNRLAAARLETLRAVADPPRVGEAVFVVPEEQTTGLRGFAAKQSVRRIEPGLFEVAVELRWLPVGAKRLRKCRLVTFMEWEGRR